MDSGVIRTTKADGSEQVDYLYRVSLRAIVRNDEGKVLAVKEHGDQWHLPGGGLDYGETIEQGLTRELREETGYVGKLSYRLYDGYLAQVERLGGMKQFVVLAEVTPESFDFPGGSDSEKLAFVDESQVGDFDLLEKEKAE